MLMKQTSESNQALQVLTTSEVLGRQFTIYGDSEKPLFLARDVADMIEYSDGNASEMMKMVDSDEKVKIFCNIDSNPTKVTKPCESITYSGANRWFLTEDGLYEVLMQSNKPIAKQFKKGVKTILKEIRKNGGYIATNENDSEADIMARALLIAQNTIERKQIALERAKEENEQLMNENKQLAQQNEQLQEDADYAADVLQSKTTYTMTQISKDLGFKSIYALQKFFTAKNIMYRQSNQWMPTSRYSGKGFFATRTTKYVNKSNEVVTSMYTVVTEKGRCMLHGLME